MGYRLDKQGLLKFVINLLIGIFCLIILFYLFSGLLSILFPSHSQQKIQAGGTLDEIYNAAAGLKLEEKSEVMIYAPQGYYLMSFAGKDGLSQYSINLPPVCKNSNCLCICQWAAISSNTDCIKNADCRSFDVPFFMDNQDIKMRITKKTLSIIRHEKFFEVKNE